MKRIAIMLLAALVVACSHQPKGSAAAEAEPDGVEVLSFHSKKRCPTCLAIERLTREVVETEFAAQLADGSLRWRVVDIDREEALAGRYEVTWSSLLVNRHRGGTVTTSDMTRMAFANARTNPDKFREALRDEIDKMLAR